MWCVEFRVNLGYLGSVFASETASSDTRTEGKEATNCGHAHRHGTDLQPGVSEAKPKSGTTSAKSELNRRRLQDDMGNASFEFPFRQEKSNRLLIASTQKLRRRTHPLVLAGGRWLCAEAWSESSTCQFDIV